MVRTTFATVRLEVEKDTASILDMPDILFEVGSLHDATQEVLWVVSFDSVMNLRTIVEIARGGYHSMDVPIPAVLTAVLLAGTDRFVIAHNHSTGVVDPTVVDVDLTRKIMTAANACGLYFEDHYILGPNHEVFSFADEGILTPAPELQAMAKAHRKATRKK